MNIKIIQTSVERVVKENATTILTVGGVVGTVVTGVLAWRGGYKYQDVLTEATYEPKNDGSGEVIIHPLSTSDKAKLIVPHVVPPIILGTGTIAAIIFSHRMSAQKAAALAAAYGLSKREFEEYREKITEKLGLTKEQKIKDDLAQDRVSKTPGASNIVVIEGGDVLCFDQPTGRYFKSSMEKIRQVVNQCNEEILHHDFVSADHFYGELGLPPTTWGNELGFNSQNLVEIEFTTTMSDDGKPCIAIDFKRLPTVDYQQTWG